MDTLFIRDGIAAKFYKPDPLSLTGETEASAAQAFGADALLIMKFKNGVTTNGFLTRATFDARVLDMAMKKPVWRAAIEGSGYAALTNWDWAGKAIAEEMAGKLGEDKILRLPVQSQGTASKFK